MRSGKSAEKKAAAEREAAIKKMNIEYDAYRQHLAMSMISDMFEHHAACRFKDCRSAGRCLAFDKATGVCPMPLDMTHAMMFLGMIWFHEAMSVAENEAREASEDEAWSLLGKAFGEALGAR